MYLGRGSTFSKKTGVFMVWIKHLQIFEPGAYWIILSTPDLNCKMSEKSIIYPKKNKAKFWKKCKIQPQFSPNSNHQPLIYLGAWGVQYGTGLNVQWFCHVTSCCLYRVLVWLVKLSMPSSNLASFQTRRSLRSLFIGLHSHNADIQLLDFESDLHE